MTMSVSQAGKEIRTSGARIAGVVSCVPELEICNEYFLSKFGEADINDVIKMIGVHRRRWVDKNTTTKDLCLKAAQHLLRELDWNPESVDAIVFLSQTPDYYLPATACVLHSDLGLHPACISFDVNLGCSGYPYALWLGMSMIQTGAASRVLLLVGDTISKLVDPSDRSTAFLFGDAGTATALEKSNEGDQAQFILGTDGRGSNNLIVPSGSFRNSFSSCGEQFHSKNPNCLYMDGGEIFNFTLRSIPQLVSRIIEISGCDLDTFDGFLFHQANYFMLKHLAKKSKIPLEKLPININNFGNTSSASIPLLMTTEIRDSLLNSNLSLCMFGFGVGYSWGAASMSVGPLDVAETIIL